MYSPVVYTTAVQSPVVNNTTVYNTAVYGTTEYTTAVYTTLQFVHCLIPAPTRLDRCQQKPGDQDTANYSTQSR